MRVTFYVLLYAFGLVANCQPPAALCAASGDYAAATLRTHAREETVLALAWDTLGLVGALDHPVVFLLLLNCRPENGTIRQCKMYFGIIRYAYRGVKQLLVRARKVLAGAVRVWRYNRYASGAVGRW